MQRKYYSITHPLLFALLCYATSIFAIDLDHRPDIVRYIQALSTHYHLDQKWLTRAFTQTAFDPRVLKRTTIRTTHTVSWQQYRRLFITPARIKKGLIFQHKNRKALKTAALRYGVPEYIILGILGVETNYGENTGHFFVFPSLVTLSFAQSYRSDYFRHELGSFLLLCKHTHWNPMRIKGAYDAGLGLPQFMPSSYIKYAISAHGKRYPDLIHHNDDAIYSIAHYLQKKGWHAGRMVVAAATLKKGHTISAKQTYPTGYTSLKHFSQLGIVPKRPLPSHLKAKLVLLQCPGKLVPWFVFHNFAVIKKYNASTKYAMAVYQLGSIVKALTGKKT